MRRASVVRSLGSRLRLGVGLAAVAGGGAFPTACHDGAGPSASVNANVNAAPGASNGAPQPSDANDAGATSLSGTTNDAANGAAVPTVAAGVDISPDGAAAGHVIVHADDDGKTFDLTVGSRIVFALANHAGTGFIWTPTRVDESILAPNGMRRTEAESDVPGAPNRDVLRFIAKNPGTTVVEMTLKRPFGNAPPGPAIHITVRVH
jgi:predicted secreted protein